MEPIQKLLRQRDCHDRMTMLPLIVLKYLREKKLVKKACAGIERKCTSSAFYCTFATMTVAIMTDKSPRQITLVAYKK